ncbi:MAG TPA: glucose-1-phosphate cytidylyltransferase [Clostridia bacterium]|nr:glucose-1-phosphate cytidylyltransferase [Clostridia bacterium]
MKTVILCGGKGTRMREETEYRPKPLVDVGGRPIIWHIMKIYSHYGFNDFILCTGYKGDMLKQYFIDMHWRNNDFTLNFNKDAKVEYLSKEDETWKVTVIDTGLETMTGGRLKMIERLIDEEIFMFTYGDGLSDINLNALLDFHLKKKKTATITGVHPVSPFGILEAKNDIVKSFKEKPVLKDIVNGGFMVLNKSVFNYIPDKDCFFEQEPLHSLVSANELAVYTHKGFWTSIDTYKDVERVNSIWNSGEKAWKVW